MKIRIKNYGIHQSDSWSGAIDPHEAMLPTEAKA